MRSKTILCYIVKMVAHAVERSIVFTKFQEEAKVLRGVYRSSFIGYLWIIDFLLLYRKFSSLLACVLAYIVLYYIYVYNIIEYIKCI
jgi:hypothetical protein